MSHSYKKTTGNINFPSVSCNIFTNSIEQHIMKRLVTNRTLNVQYVENQAQKGIFVIFRSKGTSSPASSAYFVRAEQKSSGHSNGLPCFFKPSAMCHSWSRCKGHGAGTAITRWCPCHGHWKLQWLKARQLGHVKDENFPSTTPTNWGKSVLSSWCIYPLCVFCKLLLPRDEWL